MDLTEDIEDRRSVVIAMSEQFPHVWYAQLAGNPDKDQPTWVVWHGLRRKTVGEVGKSATTAVICGTSVELLQGICLALWRMLPLACDEPDIAEAFIGVSFREAKVCIRLTFTTAFHAYDVVKYIVSRFRNLKLMVKAGHCAGPFHKGTVVILDHGFNAIQAGGKVVCYDCYNREAWSPEANFPSTSMRDFSYRVSMNIKETLQFPYS